jgi:putative ABC transport system permease protein
MLFSLRPLPYAHPEGIMFLDSHGGQGYQQPASRPAFVEQGTRDKGVRMALGATRKRILTMVLLRVMWMLAAGAIVGLVLTVVVRKLISMVIYFDAQKEAGGFLLLALLLVAGLVAALIPAARAASIEPMQALRSE